MLYKQDVIKILFDIASVNEPVFRTRHAACITYKNSIISLGVNSYKTHPLQSKFSKHKDSIYLHAEIDAIRNAKSKIDLSKCTLYVARVKWKPPKKEELVIADSTPCKGCYKAIEKFNIKYTIFTKDKNSYGVIFG